MYHYFYENQFPAGWTPCDYGYLPQANNNAYTESNCDFRVPWNYHNIQFAHPEQKFLQQTVPQHKSLQYNISQYNIPQYNIPQYSIPQYSIPQYSNPHYNILKHNFHQFNIPQQNMVQRNFRQHNIPEYNTSNHNISKHNFPQTNFLQYNFHQHNTLQQNSPQNSSEGHISQSNMSHIKANVQPVLPVKSQPDVKQEQPIKKRCISLETFMETQYKPQKGATINDLKQIPECNSSSSSQTGPEFKFVSKSFDGALSDSSGVSSGDQNLTEQKVPQAPKAAIIDCAGSSGIFPAAPECSFGSDFENELLRIAIQFGSQPRLRKFIFQVDNQLREDFALDNFDSPNPVVRMSRFKFNWIFQDQPQMSRRFKQNDQPKSCNESSETEKNLFTARQKSRIGAAISDIEEFITKRMTREKVFLINRYRAFQRALEAAIRNAPAGAPK